MGIGALHRDSCIAAVWNSHGDHVRALPEGFRTMRVGDAIAAVKMQSAKIMRWSHPSKPHRRRGDLLRISFNVCKRAEVEWAALLRKPGDDSESGNRRPFALWTGVTHSGAVLGPGDGRG